MARIFVYDGREHPDPDPEMSVDQVRQSMADFFGELANASVKETKRDGDTIYEFQRRVGTKGMDLPELVAVLEKVPEKKLMLLDLAEERATDDGGIASGQFDQTDGWLSAVAEAEEYSRANTKLLKSMEMTCKQYRV